MWRVVANTLANTTGIFATGVLQLLSLPVLSAVWGVHQYGVWLMLLAIPAYVTLFDMGFSQAATAGMTRSFAKRDLDAVVCTYQSVWLLTLVLASTIVVLTGVAVCVRSSLAGNGTFSLAKEDLVIISLVAFAGAVLFSQIILAGFRSTGNYASGTVWFNVINLLEGLTVLVVATNGGEHHECALALLLVRSVGALILRFILRRRVPWLLLGVSRGSFGELRRLFAPALAAASIPIALATSLQGMVLVVGLAISPIAAAVYAAVRTLSRLIFQLVSCANTATMPELANANAINAGGMVKRILQGNAALMVFGLLPGAIAFATFGRTLVQLWTEDRMDPSTGFVVLVAAGMFVHGMWYFIANLLLAINMHLKIAGMLLLSAIGGVVVAIPVASVYGLEGAASVLLASEVLCLLHVVRIAREGLFSIHDDELSRGPQSW